MKKFIGLIFAFLLCFGSAIGLSACEFGVDPDDGMPCVVTFTYGEETYTIDVQYNREWSIPAEQIPTKEGYVFQGLFNEEHGGVPYASATGASVGVYPTKRNLVLYPQFTPILYTLQLNYGEFPERQDTVSVQGVDPIPSLPGNLFIQSKPWIYFEGWYTEEGRGGTQVADKEGASTLNAVALFADREDLTLTLYAGYSIEEYELTFLSETDEVLQTVQVEHGTPFAEIAPKIEYGDRTIVAWRSAEGSAEFNGEVNRIQRFYPFTYQLKISFEGAGTESCSDVYVSEGLMCTLPLPVRETQNGFLGWHDGETLHNGYLFPTKNTKLTAHWNEQITFNTNGGVEMASVTVETGSTLTLDTPTREGYNFHSWSYVDERGERGTFVSGATVVNQNLTLEANWTYKSVSYTSSDREDKIHDDGEWTKDWIDISQLNVFLNAGYKLSFYIEVDLKEKNDGYQELYLCNADGTHLGGKDAYEHGGSSKNTSWGTARFTVTLYGNQCTSTMTMRYGAHGNLEDDWYLGQCRITVTVSAR